MYFVLDLEPEEKEKIRNVPNVGHNDTDKVEIDAKAQIKLNKLTEIPSNYYPCRAILLLIP